MERPGFGRFRHHRRAELQFAVVGREQMEQVQAHVLAGRLQGGPGRGLLRGEHFAPERIHQFDADGDVAEHFPALVEGHGKAIRRQGVFPQFSRIVKEHSGDEQIGVERGVGRRDRQRRAHHLRHVLDQPTAPRMMIAPRRRRPAKARAVFGEEERGQALQPRIGDRSDGLLDESKVRRLLLPQLGRPGEQGIAFVLRQFTTQPALGIDPKGAVLRKLPRRLDEVPNRQCLADRESRRIAPRPQGDLALGIGQRHFPERLPVTRFLFHQRVHLAMDCRLHAPFEERAVSAPKAGGFPRNSSPASMHAPRRSLSRRNRRAPLMIRRALNFAPLTFAY